MIAQLGQLQPAQLGVIAANSTARYKDTKETVAQIARELGVGYCLRERPPRRRPRARHRTAHSGREQTHLWAEPMSARLTDVLSIQREIAEKIYALSFHPLLPAATSVSRTLVSCGELRQVPPGLHELGEDTRGSVNRAIQ